ncbi:MAG: thiopurine S-methyltransferase [Xanthomonadales bacterium]|nr:thiopurine S-methyltransferase [Xanthomonadales bacterium]
MKASFWHERWRDNDIGFHLPKANPMLVAHLPQLQLEPKQRVLVPLCGKTLDIAYLLQQGLHVVGVELNESAVQQLFAALTIEPSVSQQATLIHYQAPGLDIFVGDIFHLNKDQLGPVHAIYDRAALVALPYFMRMEYSQHLRRITNTAKQLLLCFEYEQEEMPGPPFSINDLEIRQHYGHHYSLQCLQSQEVQGGLKGICAAVEKVWLLQAEPK